MIGDKKKYFIKNEYNKKYPLQEILEIWESSNGWRWFIIKKNKRRVKTVEGFGHIAYGLVDGEFTEWGEIWMPWLEKNSKVRKVPPSNWPSIGRVIIFNDEGVPIGIKQPREELPGNCKRCGKLLTHDITGMNICYVCLKQKLDGLHLH